MQNPCEYRKNVRAITPKVQNQCDCLKIVNSWRVSGKGRICASTEKLSGRLPKKGRISVSAINGRIQASIGKMQNPCEHRKTVPAFTGKGDNQCECRKMVDSGRISGKGRIRTTTEKLSGRLSENGRIRVSARKWQNPGEYREKVEFVRVLKNCPGDYRKRVESV